MLSVAGAGMGGILQESNRLPNPQPKAVELGAKTTDENRCFRRHTLGSLMAWSCIRRRNPAYRNTVVTDDDIGETDSHRCVGRATKIEAILVADYRVGMGVVHYYARQLLC